MNVDLIRDSVETRRELMTAALLKDAKDDNPYRGVGVLSMAMELARPYGVTGRQDVVEFSMQSTSDFSNVLENVARKQLLNAYQAAPASYKAWCKPSTTPDFKTISRARISEAPAFLQVPEGAEITIGQMSDSRETYALATYGRGLTFTRQMLINDDLQAFNTITAGFGMQAAVLENRTVYAILKSTSTMSDGTALFDAAHNNLGSGAIANEGLDGMFTAMALQVGIDGLTRMNIVPRFLIVPKALEGTALSVLLPTHNIAAVYMNWFAGRLQVVADAELDSLGNGNPIVYPWFGAADPADVPGIEYCHLAGVEGVQFIRKENEGGVLGINFYAYLDFAAKAVDWRGLYKSTGS